MNPMSGLLSIKKLPPIQKGLHLRRQPRYSRRATFVFYLA